VVVVTELVKRSKSLLVELEYEDGDYTHCWTPHTAAVALKATCIPPVIYFENVMPYVLVASKLEWQRSHNIFYCVQHS